MRPRLRPSISPVMLMAPALLQCNSSGGGVDCSSVAPDAAMTASDKTCYPDNDGISGGDYTIDIAVDDTGFTPTGSDADAGAKNVITTQNNATVMLTLTNKGTKPHGFTVGCTSVCSEYPQIPAGCSPTACFSSGATIAPIAPGASASASFVTPVPDAIIFPFSSGAPGDESVPGLNQGQWGLM